MLIIFDLDDTLIDTSSSISPFQLKRCLSLLIKQGLRVSSPTQTLQELLVKHSQNKSSLLTIKNFLESKSADKKFLPLAKKFLSMLLPDNFPVSCLEGVKEILESYAKKSVICIVTRGEVDYQKQKLQKTGIDCSIFSKIVITREKNKKNPYKRLMQLYPFSPVVVCGDRVDIDLVPAKKLGAITIYTEECVKPYDKKLEYFIDYKIQKFREIKQILQKMEG